MFYLRKMDCQDPDSVVPVPVPAAPPAMTKSQLQKEMRLARQAEKKAAKKMRAGEQAAIEELNKKRAAQLHKEEQARLLREKQQGLEEGARIANEFLRKGRRAAFLGNIRQLGNNFTLICEVVRDWPAIFSAAEITWLLGAMHQVVLFLQNQEPNSYKESSLSILGWMQGLPAWIQEIFKSPSGWKCPDESYFLRWIQGMKEDFTPPECFFKLLNERRWERESRDFDATEELICCMASKVIEEARLAKQADELQFLPPHEAMDFDKAEELICCMASKVIEEARLAKQAGEVQFLPRQEAMDFDKADKILYRIVSKVKGLASRGFLMMRSLYGANDSRASS